jgi:DNA-binding winged helix-turn-helix (wHTH) protein
MEKEANAGLGQRCRYIRFGPFHIDQQRQQVSRDGTRLKVPGKVYQILLALIAKHGQLVAREELKQILWPSDTHVNFDANVNTTVNKLRQILGDSADTPVYIETIPRKGYSFLIEPEYTTEPSPPRFVLPVTSSEAHDLETGKPRNRSGRWLILGVIVLILAAILMGAGMATFWILRFRPAKPWTGVAYMLAPVMRLDESA